MVYMLSLTLTGMQLSMVERGTTQIEVAADRVPLKPYGVSAT